MACALTSNFTYQGCKGAPGGLTSVYFTEIANLNTATIAAGVITAMTLKTGKLFREYDLTNELSFFSDDFAYSKENGSLVYTPTLSITLLSMLTTLRQEIKLLAQNTLVIITKDNSDTPVYRVLGYYRGMDAITGTAGSGTAMADGQKQVVTFEGKENGPALELTSSLIASLIVAAP